MVEEKENKVQTAQPEIKVDTKIVEKDIKPKETYALEQHKIYFFTKDGELIKDYDVKNPDKYPDAIKMARIQEMTKEEYMKMAALKKEQELIFRPDQPHRRGLLGWIEKKLVKPVPDQENNDRARRFLWIHVFIKNKLFKNGIKIMKRLTGEYIVKNMEDIPRKPYNNHQRMIYHCYQKAVEDSFAGIPFKADELRAEVNHVKFNSRNHYVKWMKDNKYWSYDNRMTAVGLLMMEVLEDTFDREVFNYFLLRIWHEMNTFYDGKVPVPGEFPTYTSRFANNDPYFALFKTEKWNRIWDPKLKLKDELTEEELKKFSSQIPPEEKKE